MYVTHTHEESQNLCYLKFNWEAVVWVECVRLLFYLLGTFFGEDGDGDTLQFRSPENKHKS